MQFFLDKHENMLSGNDDNETTLRLLYYPPIVEEDSTCKNMTRCGAHCDYGTFTLLCQDSEGGLEAKLPGSDDWQRVGHLPGSMLINTGELLSLWTHGQFPALLHRVVIPEQPTIRVKGRHSMAFFVHPDNETEIVPIDRLAPETEEAPKK